MDAASESTSICDAVQSCLMLGEPLSDEFAAHLKGCSECRSATGLSKALHGTLGKGPDWTPGERVLDQYELLEEIGRGGQGAVFKARDLETGLIVALKVVPLGEHAVDEVLHAAGITHSNVCRINYTKACEPFRVIVMEYIRGPSLASPVRDFTLDGRRPRLSLVRRRLLPPRFVLTSG
jgi:serine/threonine protein kinase